jgi:hypothetical protein
MALEIWQQLTRLDATGAQNNRTAKTFLVTERNSPYLKCVCLSGLTPFHLDRRDEVPYARAHYGTRHK